MPPTEKQDPGINFPEYKLCISSTGGGGGKTLLALGLGRALSQLGKKVKPFKKGPDYIDAAWLSAACRAPATNLDPFFLDAAALRKFYGEAISKSAPDFALLEGNRGLYDGLDEHGSRSTAALARLLDFPVLLTVDCAKTTRTLAAILNGLTSFEEGLRFAGVILNNVGSLRHEQALRKAIATSSSLPVLGCLPRLRENPLPERHMGLATTGGIISPRADDIFSDLARLIRDNCDIDAILKSACPGKITAPKAAPSMASKPDGPVIGYAEDEALWFYYPENLEALEKSGAKLKKISLLNSDPEELQNLSGIYLGGGFPEDYVQRLSTSPALAKLAGLASGNLPIYAECGGLLLLCATLCHNGREWPMANVFPLKAEWHDRPQGLGYVEGNVIAPNPYYPVGLRIKAHEFHYSSCSPLAAIDFKVRLSRGKGLYASEDGVCMGNVWGSYFHIFAPALSIWAENFVKLAADFKTRLPASRSRQPKTRHECLPDN